MYMPSCPCTGAWFEQHTPSRGRAACRDTSQHASACLQSCQHWHTRPPFWWFATRSGSSGRGPCNAAARSAPRALLARTAAKMTAAAPSSCTALHQSWLSPRSTCSALHSTTQVDYRGRRAARLPPLRPASTTCVEMDNFGAAFVLNHRVVLHHRRDKSPDSLVTTNNLRIVDDNPELLHAWKTRTRDVGMSHLR